MRFTDGYAANPVCSPTRYSIMTGKYPTRVGRHRTGSPASRAGRFAAGAAERPACRSRRSPGRGPARRRGYAHLLRRQVAPRPDRGVLARAPGLRRQQGRLDAAAGRTGRASTSRPTATRGSRTAPRASTCPTGWPPRRSKFIEAHQRRAVPGLPVLLLGAHAADRPRRTWSRSTRRRPSGWAGRQGGVRRRRAGLAGRDEPRRVRILQKHAVYAAMVEAMDQAVGKVLDKLDDLGLDRQHGRLLHVRQRRPVHVGGLAHLATCRCAAARAGSTKAASASRS